ncbi:MAG: MFS transporter [Candidatus Cloacimonetes bacterium]|jgi:MFS family permease|nr:MFS transporter [Candidatus Cloacimonadota bacterium]
MQETYDIIKKDPQIWKFGFYGFFKNLKFFEPFLIIFLMQSGLNLFQIGLLYSVREVMSFIFEIPSGILADNYGKKKELLLCFTFYIISFIIFFFSTEFWQFSMAMIFFGLGEAFRSGTHKAMIMTYLEQKGWFGHKTFVYGRTRSFSMIGSALSSILSIYFLFQFEQLKFLFIICVIPYIIDMILIASYPDSLDVKVRHSFSFKEFFTDSIVHFKRVMKSSEILKTITSSSFFDATFSSIKDYIQPILAALITSSTLCVYFDLDEKQTLKISLALIYMFIYIFSAYASRNVYKLNKKRSSAKLMSLTMNILGFTAVFIALSVNFNLLPLIALSFFFLYILKNIRRPMFVDVIGDMMEKDQRATVLSVENQLTAIFTIVFAPIFGYIADNYSFTALFIIIAVMAFAMNFIARVPEK